MVSRDRSFTYDKLLLAYRAVSGGAPLIATHPDRYCPTPDGGLPDCGAMLAAIETATGVRADAIVGKPSQYMSDVVIASSGLPRDDILIVGDQLETDIAMGYQAKLHTALVLTGVTSLSDLRSYPPRPDYVLESINDLTKPYVRMNERG